jgi:chemotaxis methyl-accepting protein methylase
MGRRWRIETALSGLMREAGIASLDHLITVLVAGREPKLADEVVEALLNNETSFFRDRPTFDALLKGALPRLHKARENQRKISIWSAGCSTGQELYSLAMSFAEDRSRWRGWNIELVGTDVSGSAIQRAREGVYSQFEVQRGLSVLQMMRWFTDEEGSSGGSRSRSAAWSASTCTISLRRLRDGNSTSSCAAMSFSISRPPFVKPCSRISPRPAPPTATWFLGRERPSWVSGAIS